MPLKGNQLGNRTRATSLCGRISFATTGTPTIADFPGLSTITRLGKGNYLLTLDSGTYASLVGFGFGIKSATSSGFDCRVTAACLAGSGLITLQCHNSGTTQEPQAGEELYLRFDLEPQDY